MKRLSFTWVAVLALMLAGVGCQKEEITLAEEVQMDDLVGSRGDVELKLLWKNGEAYGINERGQIVGEQEDKGDAVLWEKGTATILWEYGAAWDINERGQIAGWKDSLGQTYGVVREEGVFMNSGLGVLLGINARGQTAGMRWNSSTSVLEGILWDRGVTEALWTEGYVNDINSAGSAVGYQRNQSGGMITAL